MKRSLPVLLATLALVAAACGDDDDSSSDTTAATAATETPAAVTEAPAATEVPAATQAPVATDIYAATEPPAGTEAPVDGAGLQLATTDLGDVLADAGGMTVYLFTPDAQSASNCYDACADAWPPVGEVTAVGDGLDATLLGTATRTDGVVQATYNGWPLYFFSGDSAPGDANGQGVNDVWWVVDASGNSLAG